MMGAHGYLTKGRFYEESVRVPLVLRWPGHIKTGRSKAPVQMMDVYPTIVEAVGGELTPGRFAKSLLPIATGQKERLRPIAVSEIGDKAPLRMMAAMTASNTGPMRSANTSSISKPIRWSSTTSPPTRASRNAERDARKTPHPPPLHPNQPLRRLQTQGPAPPRGRSKEESPVISCIVGFF
jgi:hypothetical protein